MAEGSIVCRTIGKQTIITVKDWPSLNDPWRVSSEMPRGRTLVCYGYSNFDPRVRVGHVTMHVSSGRPLLIVEYEVASSVLRPQQPDVPKQRLTCAKRVAEELHLKGVGNGALEWQVRTAGAEDILGVFADFRATGKPGGRRDTTLLRHD